MSELTPERIRDAIATIRMAWPDSPSGSPATIVITGLQQFSVEVEKEKRVEELAKELYSLYVAGAKGRAQWVDAESNPHHMETAAALITRYPALADGPES